MWSQEGSIVHRTVKLWWFCYSVFVSEQQICKLHQSSCSISDSQSTCCFCCRLRPLVGSDSACWVLSQPDSGLDSEQLRELRLHCRWHWLQHRCGAESLLTVRWKHNIQHNTSVKSFTIFQFLCDWGIMCTTCSFTTTTATTGVQTTIITTTQV